MSAGSNNIVITIKDGVDAQIAIKIKGIGDAAKQSAQDVLNLTTSLLLLNNSTTSVATALAALTTAQKNLNQVQNNTVNSTNNLTRSFAALVTRIAAAELGAGRFGGVVASLGTAAAGAGPLIVAALAVGAVVAAVEVYDKFEESAHKLTDAQIELQKQIGKENDTLLDQKETLIGLTEGPLAKYLTELDDINQKQIDVNIANINKVLDEQKSTWANIVANVQQYLSLQNALTLIQGGTALSPTQPKFNLQDAQDFIKSTELVRTSANDQAKAIKSSLETVGQELVTLHNIEQTQTDRNLANTEVARKSIQSYYDELLRDYNTYLGKKKIATAQADKAAASEQLKEFEDEVNLLKQRQQLTTPQEILTLRQQQLSGAPRPTASQVGPFASQAPLTIENQRAIEKSVGSAQQAVEKQNQSIEALINRYKQQTTASSAYTDTLKEEAAYQKANDEVLKLTGSLRKDVLSQIYKEIDAQVTNARVNKETLGIYQQFKSPLLNYNAALQASSNLVRDGVINQEQANIANAQALRTYEDAVNPLNEYNKQLDHEIQLLGLYGRELTVATEIDRIRQQLQKEGRDLTKDQIKYYTQLLTQLESQKQVQQDLNDLWEKNAGALKKLAEQQKALNDAQAKGVITQQQYKIATAQTNIDIANQHLLEQQGATLRQQLIVTFGAYLKNYQGLTKGLTDAYSQAFSQIADGAANAIGRAIVFSEDLGDAMTNVARTVASDLISAFIKLGIQWLVTEAIGHSVAAATTAATVATATSVGAAWAPAAAFSSLATLGANAAPASAAIAGTVALSDALAFFRFAQGGLVNGPGTGSSDSIFAALSNGEFVVNARATANNLDLLTAINSNTSSRSSYSVPGAVGSSGTNLFVQVVHDGSTSVDVEQMDEGKIRIIAQREAKRVVSTESEGVIAGALSNPNSRTSKAVNQHLVAPRKR